MSIGWKELTIWHNILTLIFRCFIEIYWETKKKNRKLRQNKQLKAFCSQEYDVPRNAFYWLNICYLICISLNILHILNFQQQTTYEIPIPTHFLFELEFMCLKINVSGIYPLREYINPKMPLHAHDGMSWKENINTFSSL